MTLATSPSWTSDLRDTMAKGWAAAAEKDELFVEQRDQFELPGLEVHAVYKENGDVIFQFFSEHPSWPGPLEARTFLAEVIESHFGDTSRFSASYVPELASWGVRAAGLANIPSFSKDYHVNAFVQLVSDALHSL